jgi:hypothetical protein
MNHLIRLTSGLLCLGVLAVGIMVSHLGCPLRWDGDNRPSIAEVRGREERLKQRHDAWRRRLEAKRQVAEEVIAQRRSLAEAIEQIRALDRQWPQFRSPPQAPSQLGMSEDEFIGRNILAFVQEVLTDRPAEAAKVAGRLEKELQELLAARKKRRPAPAEGSR